MNEERAEKIITEITGQRYTVTGVRSAHGGCISDSYKITTLDENLFLKESTIDQKGLFQSEARGLKELTQVECLTVPEVLGTYETDRNCYVP